MTRSTRNTSTIMQTLFTHITAALLFLSLGAWNVSRAAETSGELVVSLEGRTASTNRVKAFWSEWISPCYPIVRMYKEAHWEGERHCYDKSNTSEYTYNRVYRKDAILGDTTNCNDVIDARNVVDGVVYLDSIASQTQCDGPWSNSPASPPPLGSLQYGTFISATNIPSNNVLFITNYAFVHIDYLDGVFIEQSDVSWERITYTSEYTTEELLTNAIPFSGDWSAPGRASLLEIDNSQKSATVRHAEYRFKVLAPKDRQYKVNYTRCRAYTIGGLSFLTRDPLELQITGTGQTQYYPLDGPVVIGAPLVQATNASGCVYYVPAEEWIELAECGTESDGGGSCGSTCPSSPGGFGANLADYGLSITASLGSGNYGADKFKIIVAGDAPSAALFTPAAIEYFGNLAAVKTIRTNNVLRQIKAPQLLADIVPISSSKYEFRFYSYDTGFNTQTGLYVPYGTPFSIGTVERMGTDNHLRFTVSNGTTSVYDYEWSPVDSAWTLTAGGGLRKETRIWNGTSLAQTNTVRNSANEVASQEVTLYQTISNFGNVKSRRIVDPAGAALTTQWFYYGDAQNDGTNYGQVKMVIEPTGFWKRYEYDSLRRITKEVSQFQTAATNAVETACRVAEYDYSPVTTNCTSERRVEKLLGQEISRQYSLKFGSEDWLVRCVNPGAGWADAGNAVDITRYYTSGAFVGKVWKVTNADGTMQIHEYGTNSTVFTNTVYSGEPNQSGTAVVKGTKRVTSTGVFGELLSESAYDIASGLQKVSEVTYSYTDNLRRTHSVSYLDGTQETIQHGCCGLESTTSRDGVVTSYLYDALKRQIGTVVNGIATGRDLDAAGRVLRQWRQPVSGSEMTLGKNLYDLAGRLLRSTNGLAGVTAYTNYVDGTGLSVNTSSFPDNGVRTVTSYPDGSLVSVTGSATFPVYYDYGAYSGGTWTKETKAAAGGQEWVKAYTDMLGRTWKSEYPGNAVGTNAYNAKGQLEKSVDPDGVTVLYAYNGLGEVDATITDMNRNGLGTDSNDRVTRTTADVIVGQASKVYKRTRVYQTADSGAEVLLSENLVSADGNSTIALTQGIGTTNQMVWSPGAKQRSITATHSDGSQTVTTYTNGVLARVVRYADSSGASILLQTDYAYDEHGRKWKVIDARNGATIFGYNAADLVATNTTPAPRPGASPLSSVTLYDSSLRATNVIHPDQTSTKTVYYATGLPQRTWGSRVYPVFYSYDGAGRLSTMFTWQAFNQNTGTGQSGAANTQWIYDSARGWLNQKKYQGANAVLYGHTPAGRLFSRTWVRGVATWYTNNAAGELEAINYSDATPDVTYTFDRRGRQTAIAQAGGTTINRLYNDRGQVTQESYAGGVLGGIAVTNTYDTLLRRTNLSVLGAQGDPVPATQFGYDSASRLSIVRQPAAGNWRAVSAAYSRVANSALIGQITFATNGVTMMNMTKGYDALNRLTNIAVLNPQGQLLDAHDYGVNAASQRTSVTNLDGSYWVYSYDSLGQVVSGKKYWADNTPVAGQQFDYAFDSIGNRQSAGSGDANGANLRTGYYTNNLLNQITGRTVPGYVGVVGTAHSNATVTLWAGAELWAPAQRQGEYYRAELPVDNSSSAVWLSLTNVAVLNNGTNADIVTNTTGKVFLGRTPELFTYDLDGNLTRDGRWFYTWDAENRLVRMSSCNTNPAVGPQQWLEFGYDAQGRRISKRVGALGSTTATNELRFVYDGWNLIRTLNPQLSTLNSFAWGLDLYGSEQGAGGVGGLLWVNDTTTLNNQPSTHFVSYDGNGNVVSLRSASDGSESARYEHGPFGELIRATGPMGRANPFRFSTKYQDEETGLLYYGYRYYSASMGRWISKDPIGELGGNNLYCILNNNTISHVDLLGNGDFAWLEPELKGPYPRVPGQFEGGWVDWAPFSPEAEVFPTRSCCFHVRLSGGVAATFGEYTEGPVLGEDPRTHELYHVTAHLKPAYVDYKGKAAELGKPCMSLSRAHCIMGVILAQLKAEYVARSYRDTSAFDYQDYGSKVEPTSQQALFNKMTQLAAAYQAARNATTSAIVSCLLTTTD